MKPFHAWLSEQRDRDDPVGDFARDVAEDPDFPKSSNLRKLDSYLETIASASMIKGLYRAFAEYEQANGRGGR